MSGEPWVLIATVAALDAEARAGFAETAGRQLEGRRDRVLLATCHRVELYGLDAEPPGPAAEGLRELRGEAAVRHLFRVAAGLESAVVGEDEVLRQVRDALAEAKGRQVESRLTRLFERAIAAGRAARAGPRAPRRGLAERAIAWLDARVRLDGRPVLVAGTGVVGSALAGAAGRAGASVTVAGHTPGRAALTLADAAEAAPRAAAIAVALGGQWRALAGRGAGLPPVADLSSPSALPPEVRARLGADFLGIDDLWARGEQQLAWSRRAEALVESGLAECMDRLQCPA